MISYNREIFIIGFLVALSAGVAQGISWAMYHEISVLHLGVAVAGLFLVGASFWIMGGATV